MANNTQELDFSELSSIKRSQENSGILLNLRKDLYPEMGRLIEKSNRDLASCDPDSPNFVKYARAKEDIKKVAVSIVDDRMKKIVNMALISGKGGNNITEPLTPEERELYDQIANATRTIWNGVFSRKSATTLDITDPDAPPKQETEKATVDTKIVENVVPKESTAPAVEVPVAMSKPPKKTTSAIDDYDDEDTEEYPTPKECPVPSPEPIVAKEDEKGTVVIRVLEDTPPFAGLGNVVYNLKKEDIVRMPSIFANALINRGLAKQVML